MERVELHFHLLPGVDDGPPDMARAVELARATVADGTRIVTVTPHAHAVDFAEVPERTRELQAVLEREGVALQVQAGTELSWDDVVRADDPALEALAHGPVGRRWLLLEAPLPGMGELEDFEAAAQELHDRDYALLIGHPERSPAVRHALGAVDRLLAAGDRVQVNGSSLTGYHGRDARLAGLELVRSGRATVIASDAHALDRGPVLTAAAATLREDGVPAVVAEGLVSSAPRALLAQGIAPARRLAA